LCVMCLHIGNMCMHIDLYMFYAIDVHAHHEQLYWSPGEDTAMHSNPFGATI
jgi:hypothetical protein